ncbi:MAG: transglycosylase domain-containing protein [Planctomycetes bacterium]|nr:transglycosylase domain-containing protein [Planctomycetota bacterium]
MKWLRRRWRALLLVAAVWPGVPLAERLLDRLWPVPRAALAGFAVAREVLAADGTVLRVATAPGGERILPVDMDRLPPQVVHALLASEDRRFFAHGGVDFAALARAAVQNLARGRVVSGGSTLTMQLARIVEPRPRTLLGKAREMLRARQWERAMGKEEILRAYLDLAPFGANVRGIEAAARVHYGKPARALAVDEAATLVALLPAPSRRAAQRGRAELHAARDRVLERMAACGWLTPEALGRAQARPVQARRRPFPFLAPHAADAALRGSGARVVESSLDLDVQLAVERVVAGHATGVDGCAVVVLRRSDAALLAMTGARDARTLPLNAALRPRCVGSTLKPFLYALALEQGVIGPDTLLDDTPLEFGQYRPANFDETFAGRVPALRALVESRNVPAVRLLRAVGPRSFAGLLDELGAGLDGAELNLDAALGTLALRPLTLARMYAAFAGPVPPASLSERSRGPVLAALRELAPLPGLPEVAWKSGTSSGRKDAWCAGVDRARVVVVWLGNLDGRGAAELVGARAGADLLAAVFHALR